LEKRWTVFDNSQIQNFSSNDGADTPECTFASLFRFAFIKRQVLVGIIVA
jgi:hypothetical protein